jgi:hypothetical protein
VDDIARDKLKDDVHLAYKKRDKLHEETMIELERYVSPRSSSLGGYLYQAGILSGNVR